MRAINRHMSAGDRFAAQHTPVPESGCWLWTGSINAHGYGGLMANGRNWYAHRFSWLLHRGDPGNAFVCHKCDTPSCVNPDHLFLGTHADNMADREAKARGPQGERHPRAKLTDADIEGIRTDCRKYREIAAHYGISLDYVKQLRSVRKSRGSVPTNRK